MLAERRFRAQVFRRRLLERVVFSVKAPGAVLAEDEDGDCSKVEAGRGGALAVLGGYARRGPKEV